MNSNAINKLVINNHTLNDRQDICNGLNNYFSTVGEKLIDEVIKNSGKINSCDFKTYCLPSVKNSRPIFITPLDNIELMAIINKLDSCKSPGSDTLD